MKTKHYVTIIIVVLFLVFLYINKIKIQKILMPFIVAGIIAYLLIPVINWMTMHKFNRLSAIFLVFGIIIITMTLVIYYIMPILLNEFVEIGNIIPDYFKKISRLESLVRNRYGQFLPSQFQSTIDVNIKNLNKYISNFIIGTIKHLLTFLSQSAGFILSPIIAFYILKDSKYLGEELVMLSPPKWRRKVKEILTRIDEIIKSFITGQLLVALFVMVATSIGLLMIKLRFALIIGIIAGIFNLVPYLGPIVGGILAFIAGLTQSPYKAVSAVIVFVIVQQIESGILSPKIVGDSVGLHPILVIFSLLVGGEFFGVWGMLFAIPVVATIKVLLNYILDNMDTF